VAAAPARDRAPLADPGRAVVTTSAPAAALTSGPFSSPVSRSEGQRLARAELSKSIYHPSVPLLQRITQDIHNALDKVLNPVHLAGPSGSWWAVIALIVLLVLAVAAVLIWIGPVGRRGRGGAGAVLSAMRLSSRDHRERAERMAAAGDFTAAVIESVRAVAMELEERGVLVPRTGRTAAELAAEAGARLPGHAAGLRQAARLFDDVMYGGRDGTAEGYQQVRDLDESIRAARPVSDAAVADAEVPLAGAAAGPVS
jgi:Domain of unknown function (DUF4129)